ncbi:MAG: hypothetical protein GF419_02245 [Ignavibacteriales bacterium]|nr:hypothetical protein [Ignavibacteriales bacterium]
MFIAKAGDLVGREFAMPHVIAAALETTFRTEKKERFKRMAFEGKSAAGLARALEKSADNSDVSNRPDLERDLAKSLSAVVELLNEHAEDADGEAREILEEFLGKQSPDAPRRLLELADDLDIAKRFVNEVADDE